MRVPKIFPYLAIFILTLQPCAARGEPFQADFPAYGWWQARNPVAAGHFGGRPESKPESKPESSQGSLPGSHQGNRSDTHPGSSTPKSKPGVMPGAPKTGQETASASRVSHSFAFDSRPVKRFYLYVSEGAGIPTEAPEVYYRFTARTMARHGGVPIRSTIHKAAVTRDKATWRVDIHSAEFGTAEIFSRFTMDGKRVYSQHNYPHFVRTSEKDAKEAAPVESAPVVASLPEDWPQIVFPVGSYNEMPFRGVRIGERVSFVVTPGTDRAAPATALSFEDNFSEPCSVPYARKEEKFIYAAREDDVLDGSARRTTKNAVLVVPFSGGGDVAVFSFTVSRSKWSGLDLNSGLILLFGSAVVTIAAVLYRRRRFKYYDRN